MQRVYSRLVHSAKIQEFWVRDRNSETKDPENVICSEIKMC